MKPILVIVGRPNVGKSTLFNRLTRSRAALVADLPGLTRDRHYGYGRIGEKPFLAVDTGGFEPVVKEGILYEMAKQTRQAMVEADVIENKKLGLGAEVRRVGDAGRSQMQFGFARDVAGIAVVALLGHGIDHVAH